MSHYHLCDTCLRQRDIIENEVCAYRLAEAGKIVHADNDERKPKELCGHYLARAMLTHDGFRPFEGPKYVIR